MRINNARLADGRIVDIVIEGSKITGILERQTYRINSINGGIDATGLVALPGGIDLHVHPRTPGARHKEDWPYLARAALRGGTTSFVCVGNNPPCWTTVKILDQQRQEIEKANLKVNVLFWATATPDNLDELDEALKRDDVVGSKVFLGSGPPGIVVKEYRDLIRIAELNARHSKLVPVHTEVEELMRLKRMALGREPMVCDHGIIHDIEAEVAGVRLAIRVSKETGCTMILFHLTCRESIELAADAKAAGIPIRVETCPQYFIFDETMTSGPKGGRYKVNPALRPREQVDYVLRALRQNKIRFGNSDHAPHTLAEKSNSKYEEVPSGLPGVEERMTIFLDQVNKGHLTLQQVAKLCSTNAAEVLGIQKGRIVPGYDADIVLVDMRKKRRFSNGDVGSKCGWSAYHGMTFQGVPQVTIVGGNVAWRNI